MSNMTLRLDIVEAVEVGANACPAKHPEGWLCTRPTMHKGDHAAGTSGKQFAMIWPQGVDA